ncbi:MAG: methyltransferase domain-containing protein [Methanomicrobia archaeon]|nr:methyltransferase domain-containing protein [Methanomicrobia archaeon]
MRNKKRYADRFVGTTPSDEKQLEDRQQKVLALFGRYKFERILDVGCGDGNFSVLLQEACKAEEVCGLEISAKGVELARSNGVKCLQLDVDEDDFPFEAEYFDAVFAGEVIEHVFDTDHFLDEVHRILKPDGTFVLTTPNLAAIHNRIALLFGYQPYPMKVSLNYALGHFIYPGWGASEHVRVMTRKGLVELLRVHGFKIIRITASGMSFPKDFQLFGLNLIKAIDKLITRLFPSLGYHSIVEVKRTDE